MADVTHYREFYDGFPDGMEARCDRCKLVVEGIAVLDGPTLRVICGDCLSMVEKRCLDMGVSPFEPVDSDGEQAGA